MQQKIDILKKNGSFNKDYNLVKAKEFSINPFYDANDLVQVKYEMLRSVANHECSISEASIKYGLSRQTYYNLKEAFELQGLYALVHKKTGPKKPSKLNTEGQKFIDNYLEKHPSAKSSEINSALSAELNISVHNKTVTRYMSKKIRSGC